MMGLNHFAKKEGLVQYASARGVRGAKGLTVISGILLLLGALGILLGVFVEWAIWLLVIFLVFVSFMVHHFWTDQDPQQRMGEMTNFFKNMAIAAALLMLLTVPTPWVFSIL